MKSVLRILAVILLLAVSNVVNAQDECSSATTLTPGSTCSYTTFDLPGTLSKSTNTVANCNSGSIVDDAWAKFTATGTSSTVNYVNTNRDAAIYIYSGASCAALSQLTCVDNVNGTGTETVTFTTSVGSTYYIRVGRMSGNGTASMNGTICVTSVTPPPAPSNDDPCQATLLSVGASCSYIYSTNVSATNTSGVTAPGCGGYSGGDIWFKAVVPSSGAIVFTTDTGSVIDGAMAAYSGSCGSLTLITCSDDGYGANAKMPKITLTCLNPGDTIRIRAWENGNNTFGTFRICATDPGGTTGAPSNDNPCQASALTVGASYAYFTNQCATATSGVTAPGCGTYTGGDIWFKVVVPSSGALVVNTDTGSIFDAAMAAYSGSCGSLTLISCSNDGFGANSLMPKLSLTCLTPGDTIRIRAWEVGNDVVGTLRINATDPGGTPGAPTNDNPCQGTVLTVGSSISYSGYYTNQCATATSGVTAPGCGTYSGGDIWFKAVVPSSGALVINTDTGSIKDAAMAAYSGSCGTLTLVSCTNDGFGSNALMPKLTLTCLTPGDTIYIRAWEVGNDVVGNMRICAVDPGGSYITPANDNPCNAIAITPTAACSYTTYTNMCATNTSGVTAPGCGGYSGSDVWFKVTTPASGSFTVATQSNLMTDGAMAIYSGTCSALTLVSCNDNGSSNMPTLSITGATPGTIYFIRMWENGNDNNGTFGICVTDPCPNGAPANDACADAIPLTLSVPATGNNSCASATGEPAAPSCWTNGASQLNTVWYSVVAPASGKLKVRTALGTLTNTQIQLFSGSCGSLISRGCTNDTTLCSNTQLWSELSFTGLTAGATYYVRVDGVNGLMGDFTITAIDGNSNWPITPGQDCGAAFPVCNSSISVGDPGFIGSGNTCDYPGNSGGCSTGSCIVVGERNSVWYTFSALSAGTLNFTITPNSPVDYDWALYDVTGLSNPCASIGTNAITPIRCSYWGGTSATGMGGTGTENCDGTSGSLDGWATGLAMTAGKQYLLFISNYSTTTFVGYNINFGASPLNYNASNTLVWTGAANTSWNNINNWGGCTIPDCGKDVLIYGGSAAQPVIPANATVTCKSMTIQGGASLTLAANSKILLCGSYTNYGVLNAAANSTIQFQGDTTQIIEGSLTGTNQFGNLTVTKAANTLTLMEDIDIVGNLTVNATGSIFDLNGKQIHLGGNFTNTSSTISVPDHTKLEFTGSANQTYYQGTSTLNLKEVEIDKSAGSVTLSTDMQISDNGTLELSSGVFSTGANTLRILNESVSAVSGGSTASYVQGNLYRDVVASNGSYSFPVGNSTKGYELGTIVYTNTSDVTGLTVRFDDWTTVPNGPVSLDCGSANYSLLPMLNSGYWTFTSDPATPTGNFNITLSSRGHTNASPTAGTTVIKSEDNRATWILDGICVLSSNAALAARTDLSGFGVFAIGQTSSPLPIELLSFTGTEKNDHNLLEWVTLTETNNEYFTLERSSNGTDFVPVGRVQGAGTSRVQLSYSFKDMTPPKGVSYYRLRQTDFDGTTTTSKIIALRRHTSANFQISVAPNPSKGIFNLDIMTSTSGILNLRVNDASGKEMMNEKVDVSGDRLKHAIDLTGFMSGLYDLQLEDPSTGERINMRLLRQ
jgi:hypothetical protein